ncbi:hypothetical protein PILCRDRAFT_79556, partial [Piloderma croceum F 1598]
LTIVASTGIFKRSIRWCHCAKSSKRFVQLLLRAKLFPASFKNPKTAFTFEVLDQFQLDALECKTAAMNFMSKIGRVTDEAFPSRVPDRYRELLRVSRQWRDIHNQIRAGDVHDRPDVPADSGLALFCPACPQIGINIPPEIEWKADDRLLYRPQLVSDGNMKLVHQLQKRPEDDVSLSNGEMFIVKWAPYAKHLVNAPQRQPKSKCSNHWAQNHGNLNRNHLDSTGKGACACARHGAFVPHCMVNFQKGEQQVNMDYSICQALKRFPGHVQALIVYDICCQWSIHFRQCVSESEFLELYDSLEIIGAIGKWHLAAHIPECFPKFSLNFVEGAGEVDGEILETLWSRLDEVAGMAQAMSIAHHQEVIDEHMNDSNWRKIIRLSDSLCEKWSRAEKGLSETGPTFEQLSDSLDASLVQEWTAQERVAMEKRGDHLNIYQVRLEKCGRFIHSSFGY